MKVTKKKYFKSNPNVKIEMLYYILMGIQNKIDLFILFGIVFLAYIKWGG